MEVEIEQMKEDSLELSNVHLVRHLWCSPVLVASSNLSYVGNVLIAMYGYESAAKMAMEALP